MYVSDIRHASPALEAKLAHIYTLGRKTISLDFRSEYLDLLAAFGNPHLNLPPVIHVAGTNGKGSIVASLRAVLEEAGYKVHAYTSPHLCSFNERIVLSGRFIENDFLESLIDEAIVLNRGNDITFFELTTAMAFAAFSRVPADILLLEVGLGGRMDCTNVIERPLVSVISSIGYDHMEFLGETLPKIAAEKGGIFKPGVPCVISRQNSQSIEAGVVDVLVAQAAKTGSPVSRFGAEWFIQDQGDGVRFVYKDVDMSLPRPNLSGVHQIYNVGASLAALQIIKGQFPVSGEAIRSGLGKIQWSARLQDITQSFSLSPGWEVWLDGGHNEDAARVLADQATQWNQQDGKKLHLILGMMNHKDPAEFLDPLLPHLSSLSFTAIPAEPKSYSAAALDRLVFSVKKEGLLAEACADFQEALQNIAAREQTPGRILIAGSLYLAGHVLKRLDIKP